MEARTLVAICQDKAQSIENGAENIWNPWERNHHPKRFDFAGRAGLMRIRLVLEGTLVEAAAYEHIFMFLSRCFFQDVWRWVQMLDVRVSEEAKKAKSRQFLGVRSGNSGIFDERCGRSKKKMAEMRVGRMDRVRELMD